MKLSLAIINDDEAPYLKRFFESLGSGRDLLDIVFVDNCSRDNSIQIAKDMGIGKIITFEKKTASRPVLYNAALSRAEGKYILFTHSDIIFGDGFFQNLDKSLRERPDLDFMNFRVVYVDKTTSAPSIVYWGVEDKGIRLSYHSIWGIGDPSLKKLVSCSDSCFLVKSNAFRYERFDERYYDTFFIEDLLLKLEFQGANIVYDENSYVEHYFLEEHERLRTLKHDSRLFIKNNPVVNLAAKDRRISSLETQLQYLDAQLRQIQRSIPIQLVNRYQKIVGKLMRPGTRRRRLYELMLSGIRVILNEGWKSFFRKLGARIAGRKAGASKQPQVTNSH